MALKAKGVKVEDDVRPAGFVKLLTLLPRP
jgi:hypothetical protein